MKKVKYLEIIFNQIFKFKSYLNQVVKKEMKFAQAIINIAKSIIKSKFKLLK